MLVEFCVRNYATLDGLEIYGANEIIQGSTKVFNSSPYSLRCIKILSQRHFFFCLFYHVKTHLWMIMMEFRIVMV